MERKLIITKDGSHSISIPGMGVTYHSVQGAIQESMHVFIEAGWRYWSGRFERVRPLRVERSGHFERPDPLRVLEMGLGTGLNALLTLIEADKLQQPGHYTAIELFPLSTEETKQLNYCEQLDQISYQLFFEKLHQCEWENDIPVSPFFTLHKTNRDLLTFSTDQFFDLVYYDAFEPAAQPELWTKEVFEKLYGMMNPEGVLVTYCSKGAVRRNLQAAGFTVEKIPGPPGKREMVRATVNHTID